MLHCIALCCVVLFVLFSVCVVLCCTNKTVMGVVNVSVGRPGKEKGKVLVLLPFLSCRLCATSLGVAPSAIIPNFDQRLCSKDLEKCRSILCLPISVVQIAHYVQWTTPATPKVLRTRICSFIYFFLKAISVPPTLHRCWLARGDVESKLAQVSCT